MKDRIARAFGNFQDVQNGYISGAERRGEDCQEPGLLLRREEQEQENLMGSTGKQQLYVGKGNPLSRSSLE